ncbi:MAG: hypothetical protein U0797_15590 [Gemmataceae bacterium]
MIAGSRYIVRDQGSNLGTIVNEKLIGGRSTSRRRRRKGDNVVILGGRSSPFQFARPGACRRLTRFTPTARLQRQPRPGLDQGRLVQGCARRSAVYGVHDLPRHRGQPRRGAAGHRLGGPAGQVSRGVSSERGDRWAAGQRRHQAVVPSAPAGRGVSARPRRRHSRAASSARRGGRQPQRALQRPGSARSCSRSAWRVGP